MINFDPVIAGQFGLDTAILLQHIKGEIEFAERHQAGIVSFRTWRELQESFIFSAFPFIADENALDHALNQLTDNNHILTARFTDESGQVKRLVSLPMTGGEAANDHEGGRQ